MKNIHIRNYLGASLLLLLVTTGYAYAATYKWVDENGQVNYSQYPPPEGTESETVKPPPKVDTDAAIREQQEREGKLNSINEERNKESAQEKLDEGNAAKKQAACDLARDKLKQAISSTRLYATNEQGERVKLGEDERQARIEAANNEIAEFCN